MERNTQENKRELLAVQVGGGEMYILVNSTN
jgi:hypothetical protein